MGPLERRGRAILIAAIAIGSTMVLGLNVSLWIRNQYHPLLFVKILFIVFCFHSLWWGNPAARSGLILVLWVANVFCAFVAVVSGQYEVAAVAVPVGLACAVLAVLLGRPAVGAFLKYQRGGV